MRPTTDSRKDDIMNRVSAVEFATHTRIHIGLAVNEFDLAIDFIGLIR
jgi:hypothetical protein